MSDKGKLSSGYEDTGLICLEILIDNPSLQISPVKLDGINYLILSRARSLAIADCGFSGYIAGKTTQPVVTGFSHTRWIKEMLLSCLGYYILCSTPSVAVFYCWILYKRFGLLLFKLILRLTMMPSSTS
ncbi:hypothetical protein U1Q18_052452 [Sarracenia purpurea var. burkii]